MTPTKRRARWLAYLAAMGPGILAAVAGNDAGGVITYASAGAEYQYKLLWLLLIITFALVVVQEMCARMGAVTGKGLSDLIRENFGVRWTLLAMLALLFANTAITMSEFAGIAAALRIFHVPAYVSIPIAAAGVWFLVVHGDYKTVEKALLVVAALFLAYPLAAMLLPIPWPHVFHAMLVPSKNWIVNEPQFFMLGIAVVGTTVAPWMQFYVQASVVDKGIRTQDLPLQRADIFAGGISANVVAFFIVVVTAQVLYGELGSAQLETAGQAASALQAVGGRLSGALFSAGLLGASLLGAAAVPLTTSYAVCEAFGWERGIGYKFREAPLFFGLYTGIIVIGASVVLLFSGHPNVYVPAIRVAQQISGMITPIILIFILLLINNTRLMGKYANSRTYNIIAWGTVVLVVVLVIAWLATELMKTT